MAEDVKGTEVNDYYLSSGKHKSPEEGRCAMEWVSYIAGEPHSDQPVCVDPVLRRFGIGLNDYLPDDLRQRLRPYLARMIGTADDGLTQRRMFMVADWAIHVPAVEAMRVRGRDDLADRLLAIPEVVDRRSAEYARDEARSVADAAAAYAADATAAYAADATAAAAYAADATAAYADADAAAAYAADAAAAYAAAADAAAAAAATAATSQMWERLLPSALELLDRMLPGEVIELPTEMAERAAEVCPECVS